MIGSEEGRFAKSRISGSQKCRKSQMPLTSAKSMPCVYYNDNSCIFWKHGERIFYRHICNLCFAQDGKKLMPTVPRTVQKRAKNE